MLRSVVDGPHVDVVRARAMCIVKAPHIAFPLRRGPRRRCEPHPSRHWLQDQFKRVTSNEHCVAMCIWRFGSAASNILLRDRMVHNDLRVERRFCVGDLSRNKQSVHSDVRVGCEARHTTMSRWMKGRQPTMCWRAISEWSSVSDRNRATETWVEDKTELT